MDMYKLTFTRLQSEIFRLLCIRAGETLNQRGIAEKLKVSPTAISKSVKGLKREELIKVEKSKTMNLVSIQLNRDNPKAIALKRIENLRLVYESGILDFIEEKFPGCTIILFGSYSSGEDTINSDVDIAVIGTKKHEQPDLNVFEKKLERKIFIHYCMHLIQIDDNLKSSILNGITLSGVIEI